MAATYYVLSLPLFLSLVYYSSDAADKRCHKVPLINNFDVERVHGLWYAQEIGDDDGDEGSRKCLIYILTTDGKKSEATVEGFRIFNGTGNVSYVEKYKIHQLKDTSEFSAQWKGEQLSAWAVGTDYDTWSTWYLCQPEQADKGVIFISTRNKSPNDTILNAARNSVKKVGFKMTKPYLKRIEHSQCFYES